MRGISTVHKNALLTLEVASPLYLALATAPPSPEAITEPTYAEYARAPIDPAAWSTPTDGSVHTISAVSFPTLLSGSTTIVGWGAFSQLVGGDLLWFGTLTPRVIDLADPTFTVAAGGLSFSFADLVA